MASGETGTIVRQVQRLFGGGSVAGLGEGQLLERFIRHRDESAFEAIMARHGPMVLGVCRRVLVDQRDAEDAFQVTFLILVKKASRIRDRAQLGPWLYGVAQRVALRARVVATRRLARERLGLEVEEAAVESLPETDRRDFRAALDEELGRLPEKYRSPIVLCYLEGLSHEEAAERLCWPVGTVRSRMAWARDRLRGRLAKRGLALSSALLLSSLASEINAAPVPPALFQSTLQAAMGLAVAKGATAGIVSASAASLMGESLKVMYYHKLKSLAVGLVAVGAVTGGAVVAKFELAPTQNAAQSGTASQSRPRASDPQKQLADIDAEIKKLESLLEAARQRREDIVAKLNDDGVTITSETPKPSRTSTKARRGNTAKSTTATSGITSGTSPSITTSTTTGSPGATSPSGISISSSASAGAPSGISVTSGAPAVSAGGPSGISVSATGSARSSSSSHGFSSATGGTGPAGGITSQSSSSPSSVSTSTTHGTVTASTPETRGAAASVTLGSATDGSQVAAGRSVTVSVNDMIAVVSPAGDRVTVHKQGGATRGYRVPKGVHASPLMTSALVALQLDGDSIPELAVYDTERQKWVVQPLKEPAHGKVTPVIARTLAAFRAGRYLGAFSARTGKIDLVDLGAAFEDAEKSDVFGPVVSNSVAAFAAGKHAYAFSATTGRWEIADVGENAQSPEVVAGDSVTIATNKGVFIFDAINGKWETGDETKDNDK
jgi:RNA polymerase sigma factor (sigma-70 family)